QRGAARGAAVGRTDRSVRAGPDATAVGRHRARPRRRARPRHDRSGAAARRWRTGAGGGGPGHVAAGAVPAPGPLRHPPRLTQGLSMPMTHAAWISRGRRVVLRGAAPDWPPAQAARRRMATGDPPDGPLLRARAAAYVTSVGRP